MANLTIALCFVKTLKLDFIHVEQIMRVQFHLYVLFISSLSSVSINVNHPFYLTSHKRCHLVDIVTSRWTLSSCMDPFVLLPPHTHSLLRFLGLTFGFSKALRSYKDHCRDSLCDLFLSVTFREGIKRRDEKKHKQENNKKTGV